MPRVTFTHVLQRHVDSPPAEVAGATVRDVLNAVFDDNPRVRGYILDDQGAVRQHVLIFVDNEPIRDRTGLSDALSDDADVYVMQALSGG